MEIRNPPVANGSTVLLIPNRSATDEVNFRHESGCGCRPPLYMPQCMERIFRGPTSDSLSTHPTKQILVGDKTFSHIQEVAKSAALSKRLHVKEELNWGVNANCYAYSCNCPNPEVGSPPRQAGPGLLSGIRLQSDGDVDGLINGVIADSAGKACVLNGTPSDIPSPPPGNYLIALLTNSVGFHFMRRDENTKRWSWKDANYGSVKFNVMHLPTKQYIYINSENLNEILVTKKNDFGWMYGQMDFRAFLSIPNEGIVVAGVNSSIEG